MSNGDMFREYKNVEGRLMLAEPWRERTGFRFEIWFDYTRLLMNELKDGDLVAVPNFTLGKNVTYSVLEITNVLPIHHALGREARDIKGYPGYLMEAAKNIAIDWKEQELEPSEDTTKIICDAIPTNLEIIDDPKKVVDEKIIKEESAMPMPGEEVKLLSQSVVKRVINLGIDPKIENAISIGSLLRDKEIKILLRVEDLIKIHFGIFGFTGVGKSNLISTMINKLLTNSKKPIKIVLFDLMDEYKGILADQILRDDINTNIVCIGEHTLLGSVFRYINSDFDEKYKDDAIRGFVDTLTLPKGLRNREILNGLKSITPKILRKIKVLEKEIPSVRKFVEELRGDLFGGSIGSDASDAIENAIKIIFRECMTDKLTPDLAKKLIEIHFKQVGGVISKVVQDLVGSPKNTATSRINRIKSKLQEIAESEETEINPSLTISRGDITEDLNNEDKSSLYIIISHSPNKLREFSKRLGSYVCWIRRDRGTISPLATFIFDEADEFMPLKAAGSYEKSKRVIEILARRGRKFGLGVGIATQRSSYLDTTIMSQLHTYFISKLPRKYDRDVVGEVFSMSEEQFTPTFKFKSGEWLLVSHDAIGLSGVPIPMKADNAEERIKEFLKIEK